MGATIAVSWNAPLTQGVYLWNSLRERQRSIPSYRHHLPLQLLGLGRERSGEKEEQRYANTCNGNGRRAIEI